MLNYRFETQTKYKLDPDLIPLLAKINHKLPLESQKVNIITKLMGIVKGSSHKSFVESGTDMSIFKWQISIETHISRCLLNFFTNTTYEKSILVSAEWKDYVTKDLLWKPWDAIIGLEWTMQWRMWYRSLFIRKRLFKFCHHNMDTENSIQLQTFHFNPSTELCYFEYPTL